MGSFQQISLGVICLAAAFFFGNYVNNNPPLNQTPYANGVAENGDSNVGNVQSRLSGDPFGGVEKQPPASTSIITLKTPLHSRFDHKSITGVWDGTQPAHSAQPLNTQTALPPPSQLSSGPNTQSAKTQANQSNNSSPFTNPGLLGIQSAPIAKSKPTVQIPDFSGIAAEFKNTPPQIQSGMPMHGTQPNDQALANNQRSVRNQLGEPSQSNSPLKELVNQFKSPNQTQQQRGLSPRKFQNPNPKIVNADAAWSKPEPLSITPAPTFTSQDFATELNDDIFGLKKPASSKPYYTPASDMAEVANRDSITPANPSWPAKTDSNPIQQDRIEPVVNHFGSSQTSNNNSQQIATQPIGNNKTANEFGRRNEEFVQTNSNSAGGWAKSPNTRSGYRPAQEAQLIDYNAQSRGQNLNSRVAETALQTGQRTRLPFALNETAKTDLLRLRNQAQQKMGLESTQFVNHVIENGESLQTISSRYFGKPDYYLDIYIANRDKLRNPQHAPAGVTIRVPMYESP